ncbi:hypothetical protein HD806DRAFT_62813 [Xylariaceae sp. AK1471]|nr:hypothetical protein HD806DRAFT_62813 [Xylariaceae sp. AK1471]
MAKQMTKKPPSTLRDLIREKLYRLTEPVPPRPYSLWHYTLDKPLSQAETEHFTQIMDGIDAERHPEPHIMICSMCYVPKFMDWQCSGRKSYLSEVAAQSWFRLRGLQEFDPLWGMTSCCHRRICNSCLYSALKETIRDMWWEDIVYGEMQRLRCPLVGCNRSFLLQPRRDLYEWFESVAFDLLDFTKSLRNFKQAGRLRRQLSLSISEISISQDDIRRSIELHKRLASHGYMRPLIPDWPDAAKSYGGVRIVDIEATREESSTRIPLFTEHFRKRARECSVCVTKCDEFDLGDLETWARAIEGCRGNWTWLISDFPTSELLPECRHAFDVCQKCIATHIEVQLDSRGQSAVNNIVCPSPDCSHKFTHAEIRRLATAGSFSTYDRFATINTLSALPNFRWCLRPGCSSGGLYESPPAPFLTSLWEFPAFQDPNHVICSDCGFGMCYECQVPWHMLRTCEEYKSKLTSTEEWISANTKRCPGEGCGVPIQKGLGCFHMTCRQCSYEFCWECLASWDNMFVGRQYTRDGHADGCYFRGDRAWLPTMVDGPDLEDALLELGDVMPGDSEDGSEGELD